LERDNGIVVDFVFRLLSHPALTVQTKYTEEELVALLKSRSDQAFSVIYDNYSAALYGVINRIIGDEEQASDILQESFVKIWKNSEGYDASKGRLFTWMLNIARNSAIDATRSKQHKAEGKNRNLEDSVRLINKARSSATSTDHIGLKEVVEKLKPEYRQIIDLLYYGGYTQEEVAKELGIPLGTVKTRSRAALLTLRELMRERNL
jgi:RNA polymerase sigma-70 factor (ECF subfamily)